MSDTTSSGSGLSFAGLMLTILGIFNLFDGYAMLQKANYFEDKFIASNADTWGWILIVWAVLQLGAGIKLMTSGGGRSMALFVSSVGMVLWFALLFVAPFAALIGTYINYSIIVSVLSSDS